MVNLFKKKLLAFILILICGKSVQTSADFTFQSKIYVAGHNGLVGSAIVRALTVQGHTNIITCNSKEVDLRRQDQVEAFFNREKPEYVFLAAAKVGGIKANMTYPADFIYDNLAIELNVIKAAFKYKTKKLLFLGSSCIYPKFASQPMVEDCLLTSKLEPSNEYYAIAKIAGIKLCEAFNKQYPDQTKFISCMPCNLYGPGDNWNLETSHVLTALIQKIYRAKQAQIPTVMLLGTGNARREFLHADDVAQACILLMQNYTDNQQINIGSGQDLTIRELADKIKTILGYTGEIKFNAEFPDGTPQKLLNINKITNLGWRPLINLNTGISLMIQEYYKFK